MNGDRRKHTWILEDEMMLSVTHSKSFHAETTKGHHFSPTRYWQRSQSLRACCIIQDTGNEHCYKLLVGV